MTLCVWWNDRQEAKRGLLAAHNAPAHTDELILAPQTDAA
jgi:hypothetical protein